MEINKGVEARKRQWGQHDFRFPCWLQSNWIMSRKMGSSWERAGAWTSESLALKTNSRRSKLKSFMGTGEASGLLVHKDLIADSRDIWAARANEQEVMEEGSALNSGQYIPFFFFCDLLQTAQRRPWPNERQHEMQWMRRAEVPDLGSFSQFQMPLVSTCRQDIWPKPLKARRAICSLTRSLSWTNPKFLPSSLDDGWPFTQSAVIYTLKTTFCPLNIYYQHQRRRYGVKEALLPFQLRMHLTDPTSSAKQNVCPYLRHGSCLPECYQTPSLPGEIFCSVKVGSK